MPSDLAVRCTCGALRGVVRDVSPGRGNHVVCYCDDCQTFARFLERAEGVLDAHGGTEIFQTSAAARDLDGTDRLACMRLTPRGLLAGTPRAAARPIGNTLATRQVPFVGLVVGVHR
jgi:hypothetical protein